MTLLTLRNISKKYVLSKNKYFTALSDINLSFADKGFVAIVGKSGSGKSTLLNLIARMDTPSSGEICLSKKKYDSKEKKLYKFYREQVGMVFQNYNLIESKSTLYNVALPLLISGVSKKKAYKKASEILSYVNIEKSLFDKQVSKLSGGEKQRVSIARAVITNPKILLCDEPTGALDSGNSITAMSLLKKLSKSYLIILVSHNLQLVEQYCDRIIELSDGKVINDRRIAKVDTMSKVEEKTLKGKSNWINYFSFSNFTRRIKRNLFVILSLLICMIMGNLVVGFINGKDQSIKNACYKQFDYGYGLVSKEETVSNTGILKLTKSVRPSLDEISKEVKLKAIFEICPNFSAILPQNLEILYDGVQIENLLYTPIYSFEEPYFDSSLISQGKQIFIDSLDIVIINKKCYETIKKVIKKDPLYEPINLSYQADINYVVESGEYITDRFEFNISPRIVSVVDELDYLATSKIYYSHLALESFMQEYVLNNLSTYYDSKITWYDRVVSSEDYSYISGYSYQVFLKDYRYRKYVMEMDIVSKNLTYTSNSKIISDSLINFLEVAKYALILFLTISIVGTVLILSIISLTNYSEDRKISAILSALGAKSSEISDIYLNESLISAVIALVISLAISYPLSLLINKIIAQKIALYDIINIPFLSFMGFPLLYPLLLVVVIFLIVSISTLLPIKFSKRNTIKMELQSND